MTCDDDVNTFDPKAIKSVAEHFPAAKGVSYIIVGDNDGRQVLYVSQDAAGDVDVTRDVNEPFPAKNVRQLDMVATLTIEGSCYRYVYINRQRYKVPC